MRAAAATLAAVCPRDCRLGALSSQAQVSLCARETTCCRTSSRHVSLSLSLSPARVQLLQARERDKQECIVIGVGAAAGRACKTRVHGGRCALESLDTLLCSRSRARVVVSVCRRRLPREGSERTSERSRDQEELRLALTAMPSHSPLDSQCDSRCTARLSSPSLLRRLLQRSCCCCCRRSSVPLLHSRVFL